MKIMASGPITSWHNRWGNSGNSNRLYFLGLQNHCRWWLQSWNSKTLTPWKKSYDQPRQDIKQQRHYFAEKGLSSQSYGFSSSLVWIWELDHKESWAPKTRYFWTVELQDPWESLGLQGDQTSQLFEIPWTEEPGRLQSMESQRVRVEYHVAAHQQLHLKTWNLEVIQK